LGSQAINKYWRLLQVVRQNKNARDGFRDFEMWVKSIIQFQHSNEALGEVCEEKGECPDKVPIPD